MKPLALLIIGLVAAAPLAAQDAGGSAELYRAHCRKCHGVRGIPPKTIRKKMEKIKTFDAAFLAEYGEKDIVKVLTSGGKSEDMKSFAEKLTPEQMAALAKYVRELATKNSTGGDPEGADRPARLRR